MRWGSAATVAAVTVAVLGGCTQSPPAPAPLTGAQAAEILDDQNAQWWESMFPGEPRPVVEPIEYVNPFEPTTLVRDCMKEAQVPGLEVDSNGWSYSGDGDTSRLVDRAYYLCQARYPIDPAFADRLGLLSDEELDYLYDYLSERLVPCLELNGYAVRGQISRTTFVGNGPYLAWDPYQSLTPQPTTASEWGRVDARCPVPPIGQFLRAGIDFNRSA